MVQIAADVGVTVSLLFLVVRPGSCVDVVVVVVEVLFGEAGVNALRGQAEKTGFHNSLRVLKGTLCVQIKNLYQIKKSNGCRLTNNFPLRWNKNKWRRPRFLLSFYLEHSPPPPGFLAAVTSEAEG